MSRKPYDLTAHQDLSEMQYYLGVETIIDYQEGQMSRRRMLRRLVLICGSASAAVALLAACGDVTSTVAPAANTTAAAANTTAAAANTTAAAANTTAAAANTTAAAANTTAAAANTTAAAPPTPVPTTGPRSPLTVPATDPAIEGTDVTFPSDTPVSGYLVKPKAAGTYPAVIVIHENRGLTDHIKDVARRVAKAGFIVLAPDLVSRSGGTGKFTPDQIAGMLGQAKPDDLVKDLSSGVTFLEGQPGLKAGKIGVVGFCFGGGYTLRLSAANPKIVAAVPYYGPIPNPATIMSTTNAAVLAHYGGNDNFVNGRIPELEKVMKDNNKTFEKKIWDGAAHAFNNDTNPASYNENASVSAWKDTLDWFNKYLKA